jgi:hypothetical protein
METTTTATDIDAAAMYPTTIHATAHANIVWTNVAISALANGKFFLSCGSM